MNFLNYITKHRLTSLFMYFSFVLLVFDIVSLIYKFFTISIVLFVIFIVVLVIVILNRKYLVNLTDGLSNFNGVSYIQDVIYCIDMCKL